MGKQDSKEVLTEVKDFLHEDNCDREIRVKTQISDRPS